MSTMHPAADLFPMMDDEQYKEFVIDIKANGQREPVTFWNGQLLDGRNRIKACDELGIKPQRVDLPADIDPVAWVLSHNLHRRHLTTSQRSTVAAKLAQLKNGSNQHKSEGSSNELPSPAVTIEQAAALLNVSPASVKRAKQVVEHGSKEVVAAVEKGDLPVSLAAKLVTEESDKREQSRLVKKGRDAVKRHITEPEETVEPPKPKKLSPAEQAVENASIGQAIIKAVNEAIKLLKAVEEVPGTELLVVRERSIERDLQSVKAAILVTIPHSVCPRCKGKGCPQCGNHGWVNSQLAKELGDAQK